MSTASYAATNEHAEEGYEPYRALSKAAVLSAGLGLVSVLALLLPELVIFPLAGVVLGWLSFVKIRRYPTELTGLVPAVVGTIVNAILLVSSATYHSISYATEVPEGYQRISFSTL